MRLLRKFQLDFQVCNTQEIIWPGFSSWNPGRPRLYTLRPRHASLQLSFAAMSGSRQSPRKVTSRSGSAACCAESLWLSGADSLPSSPRLGWKAQPSSRAEGVSQGGSPRKGEAFPHSRRQSRFGMLPFGDFDATLSVTLGSFEIWTGKQQILLSLCAAANQEQPNEVPSKTFPRSPRMPVAAHHT